MGDLYDDLVEHGQAIEVDKLRDALDLKEKENDALRTDLTELRAQLQLVIEEKESLEKNIADLHTTALAEIARKEKKIAELSSTPVDDRRK